MGEAKDPVCGMVVSTERAPAKANYGGEMVYFCSVACQKAYEAKGVRLRPAPSHQR